MKKVGCAKCGGTMNKMGKGGSTTNKLNNPKGYAPAQKGGDNTKMGIYGVPNAGRTDGLGFKKGGSVKIKTGSVAKAKFGTSVNVQPGKIGKIRSSEDQGYTAIGKREPGRNKFAKGGVTKKLVKAQKGISTYSSKFQVGTDKDYAGNDQYSDSYSKAYKTTPKGKVISRSMASKKATTVGGSATTSYPQSTTVMDTTGYSKGKQSFPAKKSTYNAAEINYDTFGEPGARVGRSTYSEWDVPRSRVKKTIAEMKSNSGADKSKGTKVNYNSAGTKTVVHTGANGKKYVKVTDKEGKTYNKTMKMGGSLKAVPSDKLKSLGKLPTAVRNKMGFQKKGGAVKKK